ncbi:hypothetical protein [Nostoc commune]|uniref:hypothetical protein n=1 Tax=Nostoc commune TaxID=1178 RepID=UPI0018C62185|nr:hypothetical protein [Nostoc commune]MBG1258422.1 hypothetical protein [Nostoc commune BAE]
MQLRTYAKKNKLTAVDVIAALKIDNPKTDWILTSVLEPSDQVYLDGYFGLTQLQLPESKEQLQLPPSESNSSQLQTTQPTGDLVEHLQAHSTNLTATDVEALQATVQTSIIEERAELAAIRDFQTYQTTYAGTTRTLVVNDIYEKLDARNLARKQFEDEQNQLAIQKPTPEKSSDLMSEMLGILKADKFKSQFLTSKLEQI